MLVTDFMDSSQIQDFLSRSQESALFLLGSETRSVSPGFMSEAFLTSRGCDYIRLRAALRSKDLDHQRKIDQLMANVLAVS